VIRRINLYGGPGVGKSTMAAQVYLRLKQWGRSVELVQEFVKARAYEGRPIVGWECLSTFTRQFEAEHRFLSNGVGEIVTDSPLLLQAFYAEWHGCKVASQLKEMALAYEEPFPSINFLLFRDKRYVSQGRFQDEEAARGIDRDVERMLNECGVQYFVLHPTETTDLNNCLSLLELP